MIRPLCLLDHVRGHELAAHVDRFEIDRDGAAPVLQRVVQDGPRRRIDGGVVDEDIDPAELGDRRPTTISPIAVIVGDIERVGMRRSAGRLDFGGDGLGCFGIALEQDDLGAFGGHLRGDRAAQALAGAGDEADLGVQQSQRGTPCTRYRTAVPAIWSQSGSSRMLDLALICWKILDFA